VSDGPKPFVFDETGEAKRFAPATQRNKGYIAEVLRDVLPAQGVVLEIASGTGEHIVHFARALPHLIWQPSDYDEAGLASIAAWAGEAGLENVLHPVRIDASAAEWPVESADAILCINMVHIAPWAATEGLFAGAARQLETGAPLVLYGPYREAAVVTTDSNEAFDASLKARHPSWGLRHLDDMLALAKQHGLTLEKRVAMPANNLMLVFSKTA
jgi:SAM-dependent methyltransferase